MGLARFTIACALGLALVASFGFAPAFADEVPVVYGDLTHLSFTATSDLGATIVSPAPGSAAESTATSIEVVTGLGAGVEIRANGELVPFEKIGKRVVDTKHATTTYTYFGVPLRSGPNDIVATPLGAAASRGPSVSETIYGPGRPIALAAALAGRFKADGRTAAILHVTATDEWHHPAMPGAIVRIIIRSGDAHFRTIVRTRDAVTAGVEALPSQASGAAATQTAGPVAAQAPNTDAGQAPVSVSALPGGIGVPGASDIVSAVASLELPLGAHGSLEIPIVPGLLPGDVHVGLSSEGVTAEAQFFLNPDVRVPIVAGLVTAGAGSVPSVPGTASGDPNQSNARRGRIALFASGEVANNTLGTVAYETADDLHRSTVTGPFVDDPNQRQFSTYGDASTRRDDALSRDHLYARFDNGKNSAMWGEFAAQTGSSAQGGELGGFNLLVSGAKIDLGTGNVKLSAFDAKNDIAYARQVYSPTGLSTLGQLLHPDIVVGSDVLTLATIDRRTGAVKTQTVLTRNVDYALDYSTGLLRFINIPLPFDGAFDPQQILVQYEYAGTGSGTQTLGGRIETGFGRRAATRIGIGYVNDTTGVNNFTLLGEDIGGALPGGSWSIAHLASRGTIAGSSNLASLASNAAGGDTYRASLSEVLGANRVALAFQSTSAAYNDPFGGFATPGLVDYNASYTRALPGARGEVSLTYDRQQNDGFGLGNAQSALGVHVRAKATKRLTLHAGIDARNSSAGNGGAAIANAAATNTVDPAPVPSAAATAVPGYATSSGSVTQARIGAEWKVLPTVGVAVERIADIGGGGIASQPAQTSAELGIDFPKKGRAYVRELWASTPTQSFAASTTALTGTALATRSTAIGVERAVGAATTLDSEYVVEGTASGTDVFAAIGAKERFAIAKRVRGDFFYQHANALGTNVGGFNIYGLDTTYVDDARVRGSASYQLRTGQNPGSTLLLGLAGRVSPDLSILASANYSAAYGTSYDDARMGLAWRPAQNDRGVTLLEYERKDGSLLPLATHAEILSLEQLYRPTYRLELTARYAYKLDGDAYYAAKTSLFGVRAVQQIGSHFDIGAEARYLSAHDIPGVQSTGFAAEAGLRLGNSLRLAGGYNFTGSADPSLASAPTRRGVYATATSVVDQIFGWGKMSSSHGGTP